MSPVVKRILKVLAWIVGTAIALLILLGLYVTIRWDSKDGRQAQTLEAPSDSASIARGEYIFKFQAQCWSCHEQHGRNPDSSPSGGQLFDLTDVGPGFGKWYSRNLTPDHETGLGKWTDGEIVQAVREGLSRDRTALFPIMPLDWYNGMADEDVLSVVAYLRSLPATKNEVPKRTPSFMAKALMTFKVVKPMDPITAPVTAPARGVTPEYGRYLSSNLADCADCHTPRNIQNGQFYLDSLFAGGTIPIEGAFARNITPDEETGIGRWTEDQFISTVTTGVRPDGTVLSPVMPYAYYKSWDPDDLHAVYAYLKTVPAKKRTSLPGVVSQRYAAAHGTERGGMVFKARCEFCHGVNGGGTQPTHVTLAEVTSSLNDEDLTDFIKTGEIELKMPGFGKTLKGDELKDLVAFMRTWESK